jgi:hypothetical protein
MGGGPEPETLLVVFPFPEPTELLDRLTSKFPYVKVLFHRLQIKKHPWETGDVPPGELELTLFHCLFLWLCSWDWREMRYFVFYFAPAE